MNERPAPSPPDTPPPALQAGRAGSSCPTRSPLSGDRHLPTPPRPAPTPPQHHAHVTPTELPPAIQPPRPGPTGRGARNAPAAPPEGTHQSERARPPPPPPARRPRSRSRRCPRCPRPALSSARESCRRTCPPGRGETDNGAAGEGSGVEIRGSLAKRAGGTQVRESFRGDRVSLAGQWDLPGPRAAPLSREPWPEGGASEAQTGKPPQLLLRGNGVGSAGSRSGSGLGMIPRPDLEAKPPGIELCNTAFQSLAF